MSNGSSNESIKVMNAEEAAPQQNAYTSPHTKACHNFHGC